MSAPADTATVPFVKMEGAGNDYICVDGTGGAFPVELGPELSRVWSDRHFGIGSDGLIVMLPDAAFACRMAMWNADGSRGAMCGNGLRCLARLAYERGVAPGPRFTVATDAGPREVEVVLDGDQVGGVRASMGEVAVEAEPLSVEVGGEEWWFYPGDAGNPHAVAFVRRDPMTVDLEPLAQAVAALPRFGDGVNVEVVQVDEDGRLFQRTWERGSGETLACGTGASVAAEAALALGLVAGPRVEVRLRGGVLGFERGGTGLVMEGPARTVFRGEIPWEPR